MTTVRTRRTETGYKAGQRRVSRQWTAMPDNRSGCCLVNSAWPVRRTCVLPREISTVAGAESANHAATHGEGGGEVSRSHSSPFLDEGLKLCLQGAGTTSRSGWRDSQIHALDGEAVS